MSLVHIFFLWRFNFFFSLSLWIVEIFIQWCFVKVWFFFPNYVGWKIKVLSIKKRNLCKNLPTQFRYPRWCMRLKILHRLSVKRDDPEFSDNLYAFLPFLCFFRPTQNEGRSKILNCWTWTKVTSQASGHFWSNSYRIQVMVTSLIEMLEHGNSN